MCDMTVGQEFSPVQNMSFYAEVLELMINCYEQAGASAPVREVADTLSRRIKLDAAPFDWSAEQKVLAQAMRRSEFRLSLQLGYLLAAIKSERALLQRSWGQVEKQLKAISQGARVNTEDLQEFIRHYRHYSDLTEQQFPSALVELRQSLQQPVAKIAFRQRDASLVAV